MLTAAKAHKISKSASKNIAKTDIAEERVKYYVMGMLVGIKKDAELGYCQHVIDLDGYSKNTRMPIIHMLENLGYKVQPRIWPSGSYIVSW